jgi:flagellin-specific chaperone FliS
VSILRMDGNYVILDRMIGYCLTHIYNNNNKLDASKIRNYAVISELHSKHDEIHSNQPVTQQTRRNTL